MTEVRSRWFDASGTGIAGRKVVAQLIAPSGFLADNSAEIVVYATVLTADGSGADPIGFWKLNLTPQGSLAATNSYYKITEGKRVHYCVVPPAGPVQLGAILVDPTTLTPTEPTGGSLYLPVGQKGAPNGLATLGSDGILTLAQRPAGAGGGLVDSVDGRTGVVTLGDLYTDPAELAAGLATKEATGVAAGLVTAHGVAADPHSQYLTAAEGNAAYATIVAVDGKPPRVQITDPMTKYGIVAAPGRFQEFMGSGGFSGQFVVARIFIPAGVGFSRMALPIRSAGSFTPGSGKPNQMAWWNDAGVLQQVTPNDDHMWDTADWYVANLPSATAGQAADRYVYGGFQSSGVAGAGQYVLTGAFDGGGVPFSHAPGSTQRFGAYSGALAALANFDPNTVGTLTSFIPFIGFMA